MIVIKLWGGLGNQLFQYTFGYVVAKKNDDTLEFDTAFYENQPKNMGKRTHINNNTFPNISLNTSFTRNILISFIENRYISGFIRHFGGMALPVINYNIIIENYHQFYSNIPYLPKRINYYDGYWQSDKYFKKYRKEILELFKPNQEIIQTASNWRNNLNSDCCIAVHIRRGDYVRKGNKSITQDIHYYLDAIEYMNHKFKNPLFCIFSDDINWCKGQFKDKKNIIYIENRQKNGDLIDLYSISLCDHGIMSISTFSWWGNWLRRDLSKSLVIYPEGRYFNEFFMPEEWKKITTLIKQ